MTGSGPRSPRQLARMRASAARMRSLGYDATEPSQRRKPPSAVITSEDATLGRRKRDALIGAAQDVSRNFAVAAWAVRKHLDYVTEFDFHCRSGDDGFDDEFEALVREWSAPAAFDAAGRHGLDRFIRLIEARQVLDGDAGCVFLSSGQVQAIEGDRIRNPQHDGADWTHGVRTDVAGRALAYCVNQRGAGGKGYTNPRSVSAEHLHLHAHFDRFDQVRGISPIASGLNSLRDVYEGFEYGLGKLKVEQLFVMAIYRDAMFALDGAEADRWSFAAPGDTNGPPAKPRYTMKLDAGPQLLDLNPGDKADFLKSDSPGANSREFLMAILMVALKALDVPYSFFDEAHTNFYGSVGAWRHYDRSCRPKRRNLAHVLQWWLRKRTQVAIVREGLKLPRGVSLARPFWEWVPSGMPWWDPSKEINADLLAVTAGWATPQAICKQRGGGDWYQNIDDIKHAREYAANAGVSVAFDPQSGASADDEHEQTRRGGSQWN
ncbi:MAG: phage portal protein [Planctomyces sp.]|nr:phage portal protein [Planctomyces sp.]